MKKNIIIFFTLNLYINLILSAEDFNNNPDIKEQKKNDIMRYNNIRYTKDDEDFNKFENRIKEEENNISIINKENIQYENDIDQQKNNISNLFEILIKSINEKNNYFNFANLEKKIKKFNEKYENNYENNNELSSIHNKLKFLQKDYEAFVNNLNFFEENKDLNLFQDLKEKYKYLEKERLSLWSSFLEIKNKNLKNKKEIINDQKTQIENYNKELLELNKNFRKENHELDKKLNDIESDKENNNEMFGIACVKVDNIFRVIFEDEFVKESLNEYMKFLLNNVGIGNTIEEKFKTLKEEEKVKYEALRDLYNLKKFYEENKNKDIGLFLKNNRIGDLLKAHEVIKKYELNSLNKRLEEKIEIDISKNKDYEDLSKLIGNINIINNYLKEKKEYEEEEQNQEKFLTALINATGHKEEQKYYNNLTDKEKILTALINATNYFK